MVERLTLCLPFFCVVVLTVTILSGKPGTFSRLAAISLSNSALPVRGGSLRSQTPSAGSWRRVVVQTSCSETVSALLPKPSTRIFIV